MSKYGSLYQRPNTTSTRYQTRRTEEIANKNKMILIRIKEIEDILSNPLDLDREELRIYKLRLSTLKKQIKVEKGKRLPEEKIPFRTGPNTVVFIRESKCFSEKWVDQFGEDFIRSRIEQYKQLNA